MWGLHCLHKWNFFTSFNSTVPFPKWSHSGRDSFMIKRVWQLQCATGRRNRARRSEMRQEMRDDWWQIRNERAFEYIPSWLCLFVSCWLVFLPLGRFYLTFFIFSLLRISIYTSDFNSMNSLLFFPLHGMYNHCLFAFKKGYHYVSSCSKTSFAFKWFVMPSISK